MSVTFGDELKYWTRETLTWRWRYVDTSSGNHECLVENIWMRCFTSLAQRRSQRITTVNQHIPLGIVNVFTEVPDSESDSFPPDRLAAPMSPSGTVSWWTGYKLCSLSSSSACFGRFPEVITKRLITAAHKPQQWAGNRSNGCRLRCWILICSAAFAPVSQHRVSLLYRPAACSSSTTDT